MAELRLILARLVWSFHIHEVDTEAGKLKWEDQRSYTLVEKKPFEVRLALGNMKSTPMDVDVGVSSGPNGTGVGCAKESICDT